MSRYAGGADGAFSVYEVDGKEYVENNATINRGVEMMLLIKNEGKWMIVSQAWDVTNQDRPLPSYLGTRP